MKKTLIYFICLLFLINIIFIDSGLADDDYPERAFYYTNFTDADYTTDGYNSNNLTIATNEFNGIEADCEFLPVNGYENKEKYLHVVEEGLDYVDFDISYWEDFLNSYQIVFQWDNSSECTDEGHGNILELQLKEIVPETLVCDLELNFTAGKLMFQYRRLGDNILYLNETTDYTNADFLGDHYCSITYTIWKETISHYIVQIFDNSNIYVYWEGWLVHSSIELTDCIELARFGSEKETDDNRYNVTEMSFMTGDNYYYDCYFYDEGGHKPLRHSTWSEHRGMAQYDSALYDFDKNARIWSTVSMIDVTPADTHDKAGQVSYLFKGSQDKTITDFVTWFYGSSDHWSLTHTSLRAKMKLLIKHGSKDWKNIGYVTSVTKIEEWSGEGLAGVQNPCVIEVRWTGFEYSFTQEDDTYVHFRMETESPYPQLMEHFYLMYSNSWTDFNADGVVKANFLLIQQGSEATAKKWTLGREFYHYFAYDDDKPDVPEYGHCYNASIIPEATSFTAPAEISIYVKNCGENQGAWAFYDPDGNEINGGTLAPGGQYSRPYTLTKAGTYFLNVSEYYDTFYHGNTDLDDGVLWNSDNAEYWTFSIVNNTIQDWEITPLIPFMNMGDRQVFIIKAPFQENISVEIEYLSENKTVWDSGILYKWAIGSAKNLITQWEPQMGKLGAYKATLYRVVDTTKTIRDSCFFANADMPFSFLVDFDKDSYIAGETAIINWENPYGDTLLDVEFVFSNLERINELNINCKNKIRGTEKHQVLEGKYEYYFKVNGEKVEDTYNTIMVYADKGSTPTDYNFLVGIGAVFGVGIFLTIILGHFAGFIAGGSVTAFVLSNDSLGGMQCFDPTVGAGIIIVLIVSAVIIWLIGN